MQWNRFDTIIVWAGPAGSRLAYLLWESGFSVLLIDKSSFPRNKPCGGGIAMETIHYLGFDLPEEIIEQEINEIEFFFKNGCVRKSYPKTISYTVKREKFDHFLLQKALATGKVTFLNGQIETAQKEGNLIRIQCLWEEYVSEVLVGADGAHSWVKKTFFGKKNGAKAVAVAFDHCIIENPKQKSNTYQFFFGEDYGGYKWVFPNKGREFNIGVGLFSEKAENIKSNASSFQDALGGKSERPMVGYTLPYGCNSGKNGNGGILLIGDAASLIDPFTGEWIGNAILSANIAFDTIQKHWKNTSIIGKKYDRAMFFLYADLYCMLVFSKAFHFFYTLSEKVVLGNDFVIDWYVDVSKWLLRPKSFFFRFIVYLPYLLYNAYMRKTSPEQ